MPNLRSGVLFLVPDSDPAMSFENRKLSWVLIKSLDSLFVFLSRKIPGSESLRCWLGFGKPSDHTSHLPALLP